MEKHILSNFHMLGLFANFKLRTQLETLSLCIFMKKDLLMHQPKQIPSKKKKRKRKKKRMTRCWRNFISRSERIKSVKSRLRSHAQAPSARLTRSSQRWIPGKRRNPARAITIRTNRNRTRPAHSTPKMRTCARLFQSRTSVSSV